MTTVRCAVPRTFFDVATGQTDSRRTDGPKSATNAYLARKGVFIATQLNSTEFN